MWASRASGEAQAQGVLAVADEQGFAGGGLAAQLEGDDAGSGRFVEGRGARGGKGAGGGFHQAAGDRNVAQQALMVCVTEAKTHRQGLRRMPAREVTAVAAAPVGGVAAVGSALGETSFSGHGMGTRANSSKAWLGAGFRRGQGAQQPVITLSMIGRPPSALALV